MICTRYQSIVDAFRALSENYVPGMFDAVCLAITQHILEAI